jgi:hypothetical protein
MNIDDLTLGQIKEIRALLGEAAPGNSAGVHIGNVVYVNGMECKLDNALRLWKWEGGGLSLSAVANNAIEFIPTTPEAEKTYVRFIED